MKKENRQKRSEKTFEWYQFNPGSRFWKCNRSEMETEDQIACYCSHWDAA